MSLAQFTLDFLELYLFVSEGIFEVDELLVQFFYLFLKSFCSFFGLFLIIRADDPFLVQLYGSKLGLLLLVVDLANLSF